MYTVIERTIQGPQPRQQYPTYAEAVAEALDFAGEPDAWSAYIVNADSVVLADFKGRAAVPECRALACPPA